MAIIDVKNDSLKNSESPKEDNSIRLRVDNQPNALLENKNVSKGLEMQENEQYESKELGLKSQSQKYIF